MESQIDNHDNSLMCHVLEVSRSSFYYYCKHNISTRKIKDEKLKELIYKIWIDSYKRYGSPKITSVLGKIHNIYISVKKTRKFDERA